MNQVMQLKPIKVAIAALVIFTAIIHFLLGDFIFILNGLGYLVLLIALFLPMLRAWRSHIRWVLIGYTLITIIGYFIVHRDGSWQMDGLGVMTKFAEFILVLLILFDWQRQTELQADA